MFRNVLDPRGQRGLVVVQVVGAVDDQVEAEGHGNKVEEQQEAPERLDFAATALDKSGASCEKARSAYIEFVGLVATKSSLA